MVVISKFHLVRWLMFGKLHKGFLESCHMFGSPTFYKTINASMCDVSRESGNQNIFFITWRIFTFLLNSLCGMFIVFCSMSMMYSLVVFLLVGVSFVSSTISGKVSYFITSITFEWSFSGGRMLTFRMMMVPSILLGLYYESLIFTSHLFFSSYYSSFILWAFFP